MANEQYQPSFSPITPAKDTLYDPGQRMGAYALSEGLAEKVVIRNTCLRVCVRCLGALAL